jgi:hypothetical protein
VGRTRLQVAAVQHLRLCQEASPPPFAPPLSGQPYYSWFTCSLLVHSDQCRTPCCAALAAAKQHPGLPKRQEAARSYTVLPATVYMHHCCALPCPGDLPTLLTNDSGALLSQLVQELLVAGRVDVAHQPA